MEKYKSRFTKNNELPMIPAIRGERYAKDLHYGLADSRPEGKLMDDKINLGELSPLDVARLYYNVLRLKRCIVNVSKFSIAELEALVKHEALNDDEMIFEEDFELEDLPVIQICKGKSKDTIPVLQMIKRVVMKYGGYRGYFTAMQQLETTDMPLLAVEDGSYEIKNRQFNPIKVCSLCDSICHYSQYERGLKTVHKSLQKYKPKSKVLEDEMRTVIDSKQHSVPWRCGLCFTDLNVRIIFSEERKTLAIEIIMKHLFVIAGNLDELLKLGYGDSYEDLTNDEKYSIKTNDHMVVNEYFYHLQRKIIPVGQDLEKVSEQAISAVINGCHFKALSKYNSIKPELIAEVSTLTQLCRQFMQGTEVVCIGDILPTITKKGYHQWYKDEHFYQLEGGTACANKLICSHAGPFKVFGSFGALKLTISQILNMVDKQRSMSIIMPIRAETNTLNDKTGKFVNDDCRTILHLDGDTVGYELRKDTYHLLSNFDIIYCNHNYYMVNTIKKLPLTQLVTVTGPYHDFNNISALRVRVIDRLTIKLPLPNIDGFMGRWFGLNFEEHEFDINVPLFKYLCLRNLSGKITHDTLRQYAVGFALRRFVVHNKVISNPSVVYESIDIHIILSRICMMQLSHQYNLCYNFSNIIKLLGPLRSLVTDIEMAMTSGLLSLLSEMINKTSGISIEQLTEWMANSNVSVFMNGICKHDFWAQLLRMSQVTEMESIRIVDIDRDVLADDLADITTCDHHTRACKHEEKKIMTRCACCNLKLCANVQYCECCKPKEADNFMKHSSWAETDQPVDFAISPETTIKAERALKLATRQIPESSRQEDIPTASTKDDTQRDEPTKTPIPVPTQAPKPYEASDGESWREVINRAVKLKVDKAKAMILPITDRVMQRLKEDEQAELVSKLGFEFVEHVINCADFERLVNDKDDTMYYMPHCAMGHSLLPRNTFEIVKRINIPNSGVNTCAIDAYNYTATKPVTRDECLAVVDKETALYQTDLLDLAMSREDNLIIVADSRCYVSRGDPNSDSYICIGFNEPQEARGIGHMMPIVIKRLEKNNQYFLHMQPGNITDRNMILATRYNQHTKVHTATEVDEFGNLVCELIYNYTVTETKSSNLAQSVKVQTLGDDVVLSNNSLTKIHDPDKDHIHVTIPRWMRRWTDKLQACLTGSCPLSALPDFRHTTSELPLNIEEAVEDRLLECMRSLCRINEACTTLQSKTIKRKINCTLIPWFKYSKLLIPNTMKTSLKKLDMCAVVVDNIMTKATVIGTDKTNLIVDIPIIVDKSVIVYEIKESSGSQIRMLCGLCQPTIDMPTVREKLRNAEVVLGPAGFGKSTMIGNQAKAGDLCVAMTSTSVRSLQAKVTASARVMSIEKANYTHQKTKTNLFVDEALMVDWLSIILLCTKDTKIKMFGAEHQIGLLDMSLTPGIRTIEPIIKHVSDNNIKRSKISYRIGEPLRTFIEPLEPGIVSGGTHKTTYTVTCLNDEQIENIGQAITRSRPDVIITPYQYNKAKIMSIDNRVPVETTHSFQGQEVMRSMVVLRSDVTGKWDLNGKPDYLNSALTRAKEHVDILIYGYPLLNVTRITDIMTVISGMQLLDVSTAYKPEETKQITIDEAKEIPENITLSNMHTLTENNIDTLNKLKPEMKGVRIHYKKINSGVEITANKFGLSVAKITNIDGNVTIDANEFVKRQIQSNLHTALIVPDEELGSLTGGMNKRILRLNIRTASKLRELNWVLDKTIDGTLQIKIDGGILIITKTTDCPLCAGIKAVYKNEKLIITNGWKDILTRDMYITYDGQLSVLSGIINWLEITTTDIPMDVGYSIEHLRDLRGDIMHSKWQLEERLTQVSKWILNAILMDEFPKCNTNNLANVNLYNSIASNLGATKVTHHNSVIPHKRLIIKKRSLLQSDQYVLADNKRPIAEVRPGNQVETWRVFIIACLADMKQDQQIKGIGMADIDIPGLLLPLSKHFAIGTEIKSLVAREINNINRLAATNSHDAIRLTTECYNAYRNEIMTRFPKLNINHGNYEMVQSHIEQILENIIVNMVSRIDKDAGELVVYSGPVPLVISMQGKYYVKIKIPKDNDPELMYHDQQMIMVKSMLSLFNSSRTGNKVDIVWNGQAECNRIICGVSLLSRTNEELKELVDEFTNVYGWVPIEEKSNYFTINHKDRVIGYRHGTFTRQIRNNLIERVADGRPLFTNPTTAHYVQCRTILEFMDHRLVRMEYVKIPESKVVTRCIGTHQDIFSEETVRVPWLNFDIPSVLTDKKMIIIKDLKIRRSLMRNLMLRLLTGDDSSESLIAYARTVESTQLITDRGIRDANTSDLVVTLNTAWYAYYIHNNYNAKFKMLISLINSAQAKPTLMRVLECIVPGLMNIAGKANQLVEGYCEKLITYLNSNINIVNQMKDVLSEAKRMNWSNDYDDRRLIKYYFDDEGGVGGWLDYRPPPSFGKEDDSGNREESTDSESNKGTDDEFFDANADDDHDEEPHVAEQQEPKEVSTEAAAVEPTQQEELPVDEPSVGARDSDVVSRLMDQDRFAGLSRDVINDTIQELAQTLGQEADNIGQEKIEYYLAAKWDRSMVQVRLTRPQFSLNRGSEPSPPVIEVTTRHTVPKLIWTYWNSMSVDYLIWCMINTWQHHNPDYRIVVLTPDSLRHVLSKSECEILAAQTPQFASDWTRLRILKEFGGIWLDISTIVTDSLDGIVTRCSKSRSGLYQICLNNRQAVNKVYESWLIVASSNNRLVDEWYNVTTQMMNYSKPNGDGALEWLCNKYGEVFKRAEQPIVPNLRKYLRLYITERIACSNTSLEPITTCNDEAKLTLWHDASLLQWTDMWGVYATTDAEANEIEIEIVKMIGKVRDIILNEYNKGRPYTDASYIGRMMSIMKTPGNETGVIKYNILYCDKLPIYKQGQARIPPTVMPAKYHSARVMIICIGSLGDITPMLAMRTMCEAREVSTVIVTHCDLIENLAIDRAHGLRCTSKELMDTAMRLYNDSSLDDKLSGVDIMNRIVEETKQIIHNYSSDDMNVIINAPFPMKSAISKVLKGNWLVANPFPPNWYREPLGNDSDYTLTTKFVLKASEELYETMDVTKLDCKSVKSVLLTYQWMAEETSNTSIGPLTINNACGNVTIPMTYKKIMISFGSCKDSIVWSDLASLIKNCVLTGHKVIVTCSAEGYLNNYKFRKVCTDLVGNLSIIENYSHNDLQNVDYMITHGGHGTILDCIYNNVVPIIYPLFADQYAWANRLSGMNMAIRLRSLTDTSDLREALSRGELVRKTCEKCSRMMNINLDDFIKWLKTSGLWLEDVRSLEYTGVLDNKKIFHRSKFNDRIGIYSIKKMIYRVLHDPETPSHCVKSCIVKWLGNENSVRFNLCSIPPVMKLQQEGVDYDTLIDGILSLGINCAIIDDNNTGTLVKLDNGPTIELLIDRSDLTWHCKLVEVLEYSVSKNMAVKCRPAVVSTTNMGPSIEKLKQEYTLLELADPMIMVMKHGKKFANNVRERLKSTNLTVLAPRSDIYIKLLSGVQNSIFYVCEVIMPDKPLSIGMITTETGWMTVNYLVEDNKLIVMGAGTFYETSVLVNMHLRYPSTTPTRIVSKPQQMYALNKQTSTITLTRRLIPRASEIMLVPQKEYTVIVAEFDNRSHHMHDELSVIQNATKVVVHDGRNGRIEDYITQYDAAINRPVIKMASRLYVTEFQDIAIQMRIEEMFNYKSMSRVNLSLKHLIEPKIVEYMTKVLRIKKNKVTLRQGMEILTNQMGSNELQTKITNSGLSNEDKLIVSMWLRQNPKLMVSHITAPIQNWDGRDTMISKTGNLIIHPMLTELISSQVAGTERLSWKVGTDRSVPGDWWALRNKMQGKTVEKVNDVMAINYLNIHEQESVTHHAEEVDYTEMIDLYIPPYQVIYTGSKLEPLYDFPDVTSMQLWDDTDQTDWLNIYAPMNECKIFTRELPGKIIEVEKATMTRWPIKSRAVITKVCFEEGRSIIGRLKSVMLVRTKTINPISFLEDFCDTYFNPNWRSQAAMYQENNLIIEESDVRAWIEDSKDSNKIVKELKELLAGEMLIKPMNDVNVHLKLESLLKANPINVTKEQQARVIVWQRKCVCALYARLFLKIKSRLKEILHEKIVYADGLTPDDISARVRLCNNVNGFFENDLTKQDRQTDRDIINMEMLVYIVLGANPSIISSWREMHEVWRFKSANYWGEGKEMRLSGQATTALGNVITNLQVHCKFVKKNSISMQLGLFLGDDMCMLFSEKPSIKNLRNDIACEFNMQSKDEWSYNGATFCSMILAKTSDTTAEVAADVVRLKFRYEVTNGAHEMNKENVAMRNQSYLMMIGDMPKTRDIIMKHGYVIKPVQWYGYDTMLAAVAEKYNMTHIQVEGYLHNLLEMIDKSRVYSHKFRVFSNKP
ncbi:unnamed protein product [Persea americana alphaendornavirus 1]|uniref:Polyprotein n=1 Tax=Persea americana alphaendornavirus 1 TaxID=1131702 RepID=H2E9I3_9VIRU|nr:unnamed protein product [Persea americana alphaendornavirus 1]AEX28369.1 polyprotein [Persea americana alphaendornavirus 1]